MSNRALEILAKYQILELNLNRFEKVQAFKKKVNKLEFVPATKQTRLIGSR